MGTASPGERVLEVQDVERRFGAVNALDGVTFGCDQGERVALIGPNGAGKTTLINVITGYLGPDAGTVRLEGRDVTRMPAWKRSRAGLCRSFQAARVFDGLTVEENLHVSLLARDSAVGGAGRRRDPRRQAAVRALADRAVLVGLLGARAGELSHGDRRRLELAMVSARDPAMLLLDEPTAGIEIDGRDRLMELVLTLAEELGSGLLFTEHDMDVVFRFASRVLVMAGGALIFDGTGAEAAADPTVQEAYLHGG